MVLGNVVTIKFFSLLRETLGTDQLSVDLPQTVTTVAELKQWLADTHGEIWRDMLFQPNVVHAVNQEVASLEQAVAEGDEIAFFPPMTGG